MATPMSGDNLTLHSFPAATVTFGRGAMIVVVAVAVTLSPAGMRTHMNENGPARPLFLAATVTHKSGETIVAVVAVVTLLRAGMGTHMRGAIPTLRSFVANMAISKSGVTVADVAVVETSRPASTETLVSVTSPALLLSLVGTGSRVRGVVLAAELEARGSVNTYISKSPLDTLTMYD